MGSITEGPATGEFLVSEANGYRSRSAITLLTGTSFAAGHVLGKITKAGATALAKVGNAGNGVMGAITVGAGAKPGAYKLTIIEPATDAGAFMLEDPDGVTVGAGTVAVLFNQGGLSFTLADGGNNFASGDQFTITVAAGSGKFKEYNPANTDGSEVPAAILLGAVDATSADKLGAGITRDAEVNGHVLTWFSGADANAKAAAAVLLETNTGIIIRN
jgi:phage tail sheath protein FI